jgi:voltage-gated potassium channel Kch
MALLRALTPDVWQLRRLKDHIIVVGDGKLAISYLRVLRQQNRKVAIVVVCASADQIVRDEFKQGFGAIVLNGDITHEFFLRALRVERARKILLLDNNSLRSYEAASVLTNLVPGIGDRVVIHCASLRFMRSMAKTRVANSCHTFNTYHLAASGLVRSQRLHHFRVTRAKDVVIIAGFGRFGQTILEELQRSAIDELDTVIIIDNDAHRRVLIADEQMEFSGEYNRRLYEGDISHPDVWERVENETNIDGDNTVFVLGTGHEEENLRTALWLRRKHPGAMVIARSGKESVFATEVGQEHDIVSISIAQLVEENIPRSWVEL